MALEQDFTAQFPNKPGVDAAINQRVIQQTTPPGTQEKDPYANMLVDNYNQQGQFDPDPYSLAQIEAYKSQLGPEAIGPQGAALYPGLKHDINVGTYSGSMIGSNPIFVPGGDIMAVDPMLARRKALDDAAKRRAASLEPFKMADPYQLIDPNFQQKFNKAYYDQVNSFIDENKEKYGKDFSIVLQDQNTKEGRELAQMAANFEVLGKEFDAITNQIAAIDEGLESGSLSFGEETLKVYDNYKNLLGSFEGGDPFKSQDLRKTKGQLNGFINLEHYIQQGSFLDDIMGEKSGYAYDKDKGEFYKYGTTTVVDYDKAIDEVSESLMSSATGPLYYAIKKGYLTDKDVKKTISSRFKRQQTTTGTLTKKNQENLRGEDIADDSRTYGDDEPGVLNIFDYDDSGDLLDTKTPFNSYFEHDMNTTELGKTNTIKLDDMGVINEGGINVLEGSNEVQITGLSTVKYKDKSGNDQVKVVIRGNVDSPVKQAYKEGDGGKMVQVKWSEYENASAKEKKEDYRIREGKQVVDKLVELDDHTFNQIRNQLQDEGMIKKFEEVRKEAEKVKKSKSNQQPTGTSR